MLRYPDGRFHKFRVRSLVGLIPLFAVERLEVDWIEPFQRVPRHLRTGSSSNRQDLVQGCRPHGRAAAAAATARPDDRQRRSSSRACTSAGAGRQTSSCSDYGVRSLSKAHEEHPFRFDGKAVGYEPAEAVIEDQGRQLELARADLVPDQFPADRVAAQAGQGATAPTFDLDARRPATSRHLPRHGPRDRRPHDPHLHAATPTAAAPSTAARDKFQDDPHWRDYLLFYEYFHGDNGAGLGASHQTGWTAWSPR